MRENVLGLQLKLPGRDVRVFTSGIPEGISGFVEILHDAPGTAFLPSLLRSCVATLRTMGDNGMSRFSRNSGHSRPPK